MTQSVNSLFYTCEAFAGHGASCVPVLYGNPNMNITGIKPAPAQWLFSDGAYDVLELFHDGADKDDTDYQEFERIACFEVIPHLIATGAGAQCARNIRGISFIFSMEDF